jgi:hypothetical protein
MAWVQVGPHKINTALICYAEQEADTVRLYFHGEWEGNPLDLHLDEAKAFWKHLKAENVTMAHDKGSATIVPRMGRAVTLPASEHADRPKPPSPSPSHAPSHSSPHSHHTPKHPELSKHPEQKRH